MEKRLTEPWNCQLDSQIKTKTKKVSQTSPVRWIRLFSPLSNHQEEPLNVFLDWSPQIDQ